MKPIYTNADREEGSPNRLRKRNPVSYDTVRKIQSMIASGLLQPGEKLPSQRALSAQLNISRGSLREALSVLETLGFLRIEPGRGAIICKDNLDRVVTPKWRFEDRFSAGDVFQLRLVMECYAVRFTAVSVTENHLRELSRNVDEMRTALRSQDLEASARIDLEFHQLIIDLAGNKAFSQIYRNLKSVLLELQRLPLSARNRLWEPVTEHENVLRALELRDPESAAYYMRLHLVRTAGRSGFDEAQCSSW